MKKVCIFCGEKPVNKNKEHVIPKWLIELTGDPKRVANICKDGDKYIAYAWQSYTFPACEECNSYYSDLEAKTKLIIENLIAEKSITHKDFNIFLDWLDKVRIGVWLGNLMLLKVDLDPNYFIKQRIGTKDRICVLYKIKGNEKGISLIGTHTQIFEASPSCFGLIINDLVIFNFSKELIISKNIGFPYPNNYHYDKDFVIIDKIVNGTSEISYPIIDSLLFKPAIRFYQSIITSNGKFVRPQFGKTYNYFKNNCYKFSKSLVKSRILVVDENSDFDEFWNDKTSYQFKFPEKFEKDLIIPMICQMVLEQQNNFINNDRKYYLDTNSTESEKREKSFDFLIWQNNIELDYLKELLAPFTIRI